jgi:hypothetical protein
MSLPCITIPSVEVPHFDGNDFVSSKSQMSTYLREMNPQVWWMVDVSLSHALDYCPQTQTQKKCLYLKAHVSNGLSSDLSAEIKNEVEIEYGWPKRANLLWKVFEQMYDSSNSKKSSSSALENISSSSKLFDQSQEGQSSSQKEVKSVSLGKPDCLVSQIRGSDFGRTENILSEEDDCSTLSSNIDDDDDTDDEYDEQELLVEFKKLINKHIKLQKRHRDLLCSHKELMNSYILLESAHEVTVTTVKDSQPHTCTCAQPSIDLSCADSCCSKAKLSCDEHVLVETYDSFIASENDELKRENEMLKMELSLLKGKGHVQPSQDNRAHMVKNLENGSTVTCVKLPQINLKISYQKIDNPKIKKKA